MVSAADFDPWSRGSRTITSMENKVGAMCQLKSFSLGQKMNIG